MKSLIQVKSEKEEESGGGRLKMQLTMRLELKPDPIIKRRFMWLRSCRLLGGTFDVVECEDKEE